MTQEGRSPRSNQVLFSSRSGFWTATVFIRMNLVGVGEPFVSIALHRRRVPIRNPRKPSRLAFRLRRSGLRSPSTRSVPFRNPGKPNRLAIQLRRNSPRSPPTRRLPIRSGS